MITRRSILAASMTALAASSISAQAEISARIVLTGDMGTTGSALSAYLPVVGVDIKRGPEQDILRDEWKSVLVPGCTVIHMAIKRGWGWDEAEYCHRLNSAVLKACIDAKVRRLIFTSSQMIHSRELRMGPLTYYAAEKLSMEARMRAAAEQTALQVRIMRLGHFDPKAAVTERDWTRLDEATLKYWFDLAVDPLDVALTQTWSVIGKTGIAR